MCTSAGSQLHCSQAHAADGCDPKHLSVRCTLRPLSAAQVPVCAAYAEGVRGGGRSGRGGGGGGRGGRGGGRGGRGGRGRDEKPRNADELDDDLNAYFKKVCDGLASCTVVYLRACMS